MLWTTNLRDALIRCELDEWADDETARDRLYASLVALASIPVGADLTCTDVDYDGDVPPGPTGDFVDMLITYYFGHADLTAAARAVVDRADADAAPWLSGPRG